MASLAAVCGSLIALSSCASNPPTSLAHAIRVMTYNIDRGKGAEGNVDVERIARLILDAKADIVALQEIDRGVEGTERIDAIMKLADLTGMTYAFGKTTERKGGDCGNGFLVRFPILEERNVLYSEGDDSEQSGLLQLLLEVRGEEVVVMSTRLDGRQPDSGRVSSVMEIREAAQRYAPRPIIVCGDFGDEPSSQAVAGMKEDFEDTWEAVGSGAGNTYPADSASSRVDYIFVSKRPAGVAADRPAALRPHSARVIPSRASNHLPVLVEFELTSRR